MKPQLKVRSLLEAAIGMAATNSPLDIEEGACIEPNAADLVLEKGKNKKIVIVGHFPAVVGHLFRPLL